MAAKPEMLRYALLALFGSGAMPVACVNELSKGRLPVPSFHAAPLLRSACVVLKSLKGVAPICVERAHALVWSGGANSRSWSAQSPLVHPPVRSCGLCCVTVSVAKSTTRTKWPPRNTRRAPAGSDPAVERRVFLGGHFVRVVDFATLTVTQHSPQDLTGGCTSGDCALQDLEFAPSDHTRAWALSTQIGATPFKLFNTTQADLNSGAAWNDGTGNLPFDSSLTQATGIAPDPN